jgi:hypothetical protein
MQREQIEPYIQFATDWYHEYIDKGISPIMTDIDYEWLQSELKFIGK